MKRLGENGSGLAEIAVTLLGVMIICATGWYVWRSKENATTSLRNASSVTSAAYSGRQKVSAQPQPTTSTTKYLTITELGIKMPLSAIIADAYYAETVNDGVKSYTLSVHSLDAYSGCQATPTNAGIAAIATFKPGQTDDFVGDYDSAFPKAPLIGGVKHYILGNQYDCTEGKAAALYTKARRSFIDSYSLIRAL